MKVVLVLDFIKVHYLERDSQGNVHPQYFNTREGKSLWGKMQEQIYEQTGGRGMEGLEVYPLFLYDEVPHIIKEGKKPEYNKYSKPKWSDCKLKIPNLMTLIDSIQPDLIVPMGSLSCRAIMGKAQITSLRGKPEKMDVSNQKDVWVFPTFSEDYIAVSRNNEKFQHIDLRMMIEYFLQGEDVFIPSRVEYETLYNTDEDFNKIIAYIDDAINNHGKTPDTPVAWDYETNTLQAEFDGSAIISISMSTGHAKGITFPFEHPRTPWRPEQLEAIREKWFAFLESDVYKVGANIQFDIRFSKFHSRNKYLRVRNALDIQVQYYLAVTQEESDSKGLKTLAYQYTDMGGYDAPVEHFKTFFARLLKSLYNLRKDAVKEYQKVYKAEKKEYDKQVKAGAEGLVEPVEKQFNYDDFFLPTMTGTEMMQVLINSPYEQKQLADTTKKKKNVLEFQEYMNEADYLETVPLAISLIRDVEKDTDVVNPIDGTKFTYAWIPYRVLAEYASGDVDVTRRISIALWDEYIKDNPKWVNLYTNHYPHLMNTLADIEVNGMQVDEERLLYIKEAFEVKQAEIYEELSKDPVVQRLEEYKFDLYMKGMEEKAKPVAERDKEIYKYYTKYRKEESRKLSITSNEDKSMLMFGLTGYTLPYTRETLKDSANKDLKDRIIKEEDLTFMDYKTDEDNVNRLLEKYPEFTLGHTLLEYQKAQKMVTTYTQSILDKTDSNNVVHGNLKSTRTATSTRGVA